MFIGNYLDHPTDAELPTVEEHVCMHGGKGANIDACKVLNLVYIIPLTSCFTGH